MTPTPEQHLAVCAVQESACTFMRATGKRPEGVFASLGLYQLFTPLKDGMLEHLSIATYPIWPDENLPGVACYTRMPVSSAP